ncbi:MAG: DedA family protein [Cytophagales bacterium]
MDIIRALQALTTHPDELRHLLQIGGLMLLALIVYAENGLFFGFFLPGDYLLFAAGVLCSNNTFGYSPFVVSTTVVISAILGNITGYFFGKYVGKNLFRRPNSMFFKQSHLVKTRLYFMKFGGNTLILSKFLPYVRTFAPILAGTIEMNFPKFIRYSIIGSLLWGYGLVLIGAFLGTQFPSIFDYLHYIILGFLVVTTSAVISGFFRVKKKTT